MGAIEEVENVVIIRKGQGLDQGRCKHARGVGTHDCKWLFGGYQ